MTGLVFLPGDGGLLVLDGKTGKLLRSINLGHISSAAPMTYMVGGRQYIALHGMEMLGGLRDPLGHWTGPAVVLRTNSPEEFCL